MINITEMNLTWYNSDSKKAHNIPIILSLGQIKLLYSNGYYLYDNELDITLTFQDISFRLVSYAMC